MLEITADGISIDRLNEIHAKVTSKFKEIYGQDINLSADTPDGQTAGFIAQLKADSNEAIALIFHLLDVYNAVGAWLDQATKYAGIYRKGAEYSYIDQVVILGNKGAFIPKGTILSDDNMNDWITPEDITLNELGSFVTRIRSVEAGAFGLVSDSILSMKTVILGIDRIITKTEAIEGKEEETDGVLLKRFMRSHSSNNEEDANGIEGALLKLKDVRDARVYENDGTKRNEGHSIALNIPIHHFNAVVIGGKSEEIARCILEKKKGGAGMIGKEYISISHADANRPVRFDRALENYIHVVVTVKREKLFTDVDRELIKKRLAALQFDIGKHVYGTELACPLKDIPGFNVEKILVNGAEYTDIDYREYAVILKENIEVIVNDR